MGIPFICHINSELFVSDIFQNGTHLTAIIIPYKKMIKGRLHQEPQVYTPDL